MIETRNEYGFPVVDKVARAQAYAAEARQRNRLPCNCPTCRQMEMLPAVLQITKNWSKE